MATVLSTTERIYDSSSKAYVRESAWQLAEDCVLNDGNETDLQSLLGECTNLLDKTFRSTADTGDSQVAGLHNSIFRGKNITDYALTTEFWAEISAGTFTDIWTGDYFDKSITTTIITEDSSGNQTSKSVTETVRFMIGGCDPYRYRGDTALSQHHVVIVPRNSFTTAAYMNPTNTTCGSYTSNSFTGNGYYNSHMHQVVLPCYQASIETLMGSSHVLSYRDILGTAVTSTTASMAGCGLTGATTSWSWYDTKLRLMNEVMLYGCHPNSSSRMDIGSWNFQLPIFRLCPSLIRCGNGGTGYTGRYIFWLSAVVSSAAFASCSNYGHANYGHAIITYGVRPAFLIG